MNADDRTDRNAPCGLQEQSRPALTAAERAELEAEARVLIAKIRCRFDDSGIMGVCYDDFLAGWDGILLKPPSCS